MLFTVGGSPAPVAESLLRAQPEAVIFICSERSYASVNAPDGILARLGAKGFSLGPGQYEVLTLTNEEDLLGCVEEMRAFLNARVARWLQRGPDFRVWVDFTGGTKCMSVAVGLVARTWPCEMVYVGGAERTKGGLGVTIDGKERFINRENPWNALGYEAADQALAFFNAGDFRAASSLLREAGRRASEPHLKRALATLASLAEAYALWNLGQFRCARETLESFSKNVADMNLFGFDGNTLRRLRERVLAHKEWLERLASCSNPSVEWLADLLASAKRRLDQGHFDDAVARLYRFIEAAAQQRLEARGLGSTSALEVERLPEVLRRSWASRALEGRVRLGLQDAYELLHEIGDPLAEIFRQQGLHSGASALEARNNSLLAHGFQPISEKAARALFEAARALADALGVQTTSLPVFPTLTRV